MKKNNMFWGMLGFSAAIHSLVMIGMEGIGFHTPSPILENKIVTTINMIKVETSPQRQYPPIMQEERPAEKSVEIPPELPPVQDPVSDEEVRKDRATYENDSENNETQEDDRRKGNNTTGNNEAAPQRETGESGPVTDREYEALLAYIKEFIDTNLVYPPMARRRNIQGVVSVYFEIERNGELVSVSAGRSSGSSILDNAAVSLIKKIPTLENLTLNRALALNVNITYELTE
jgi:protein TonB